MFVTVTPNVCVERTLFLPSFAVGEVHRVPSADVREDAGGKGLNAARVASLCGAQAIATGWAGRDCNAFWREQLERVGVRDELLRVETPTRVATNIVSGENEFASTELIESGIAPSLDDGTRLLKRFQELARNAKLCAVCGGYAPAPPETTRAFESFSTLLLRTSARFDVPMILDGYGASFEAAVKSRPAPWCVKPNLREAELLLKRDITGASEERRAVLELLRLGPRVVLLSCGARGCYVGFDQHVWFLPSPQVQTVSPVGSGDALIGAFAARYLELSDKPERARLLEAARWGVAAGAVNAGKRESAWVSREEVEALVKSVKVQTQVLALSNW